jgi:ubiquinone/menaquinone biosynthesis C-methylase UbiE
MSNQVSSKYIHGYHEVEQNRLRDQAAVIEKPIFEGIDFTKVKHVLEIGSGVGAQTEIILKRFPHVRVTCVEYEQKQLDKAKENLKNLKLREAQVTFIHQDATQLQLNTTHDAAFICWVLEHVSDPKAILDGMKTCLEAGAKVVITEVFNKSFYTFPEKKAVMDYWRIYNDYQVSIGGDPYVGAKLGNLLQSSGYKEIETRPGGFHLDQRNSKEKDIVFVYWKNLMCSAADSLLNEGLVTAGEIAQMQKEMDELKADPNSIFFYQFIQAFATV